VTKVSGSRAEGASGARVAETYATALAGAISGTGGTMARRACLVILVRMSWQLRVVEGCWW
jgi:hypothetical protein